MAALNPKQDVICSSDKLVDGGSGVRFTVMRAGQPCPAFAVRFAGRAYAYLNRCAHKLTELDWEAGQFFDAEARYLVCATHGALYQPETGLCVAGPCRGARLTALAVEEVQGRVRLTGANGIHLAQRSADEVKS
ncbi:MAG: Rieske 2Fe-2S domain-containing protein [Pseudomonadota bacterium]|nr:MAG: Rieske 2Fe-2S domain-containing protein [Pseudomonadota bacterium]